MTGGHCRLGLTEALAATGPMTQAGGHYCPGPTEAAQALLPNDWWFTIVPDSGPGCPGPANDW